MYRLLTALVAFGGLAIGLAGIIYLGHIAEALNISLGGAAVGLGLYGFCWLFLIVFCANMDGRDRLRARREYDRITDAERRARLAERGAYRRG